MEIEERGALVKRWCPFKSGCDGCAKSTHCIKHVIIIDDD